MLLKYTKKKIAAMTRTTTRGKLMTVIVFILVAVHCCFNPTTADVVAEYDESVVDSLHMNTAASLGSPIKMLRTVEVMLYTKALVFNSSNTTREDKEHLRLLMYSTVRASDSDSTVLTTWIGIAFDDGSNLWIYPGNASIYYPYVASYNGVRVVKEQLEDGWAGTTRGDCASTEIATEYTTPTRSPTPFPSMPPTSINKCTYVSCNGVRLDCPIRRKPVLTPLDNSPITAL